EEDRTSSVEPSASSGQAVQLSTSNERPSPWPSPEYRRGRKCEDEECNENGRGFGDDAAAGRGGGGPHLVAGEQHVREGPAVTREGLGGQPALCHGAAGVPRRAGSGHPS